MILPPDDCVYCLRGIKNDKYYDGYGFDHSEFSSDFHDLGRDELPYWKGTSINWDLPDGGALNQLYTQTDERKDGEIKFKFGAIRIPRERLDEYKERFNGKFAYELFPENQNIYHGHILLLDFDKARMQTICSFLANEEFLRNKNNVENREENQNI